MARLTLCRAAVALAVLPLHPLAAQQTAFYPVAPTVIEERLHRVANKNTERQAALRALFDEAGCPQLTDQASKGLSTPNVLCTLPGTEASTVVVSAHYDKVAAGMGAVDNWSGASLLPSLLQSLVGRPHRLTFVFAGFADEERGLWGSTAYLKSLKGEEREKLTAEVNIDSVGLGPTKVWVSHADKKLVMAIALVADALKLPIGAVNADQVGMSDSRPFQDKKIPTIDFHSITSETLRILHTPRDNLNAIHLSDYEDTYRLLAAYLAYLDLNWGNPAAFGSK